MLITKVSELDLPLLENIAYLETEFFPDPWDEKSLRSTIAQPHGNIWAVEENNQVIAYLIFYIMGSDIEIGKIAVASSHRGQSYAKKILIQLEEYALKHNLEQILLEVRSSNRPAISLYERLDYNHVGVRKEYYIKPLEDAIIMNKSIQEPRL